MNDRFVLVVERGNLEIDGIGASSQYGANRLAIPYPQRLDPDDVGDSSYLPLTGDVRGDAHHFQESRPGKNALTVHLVVGRVERRVRKPGSETDFVERRRVVRDQRMQAVPGGSRSFRVPGVRHPVPLTSERIRRQRDAARYPGVR